MRLNFNRFAGAAACLGMVLVGGMAAADDPPPPGLEMLMPHEGEDAKTPEGLYNAGLNLLHADPPDYFGAIAKLEEARRLRPGHALTLSNLAAAYLKTGRHEEALEAAVEAVKSGPSLADAHRNLGDAYMAHQKAAEALREYDQAVELGDRDAETYFNRGLALLSQDQKDRAIVDFKRATEVKPGLGPAQMQLGALLALDGRHEAALGHLREARRIMGSHPDVLYNLARVLQIMEDHEGMVEAACALMERAAEPSSPVPVEMMMATQKMLGGQPCVVKLSPASAP